MLPLLAILWKVLCIETGIVVEHGRGRRGSEKERSDAEKMDLLATGERKLRSSSVMLDRSDSWERVERRARASSAMGSVGGASGLGGLTGLGGLQLIMFLF